MDEATAACINAELERSEEYAVFGRIHGADGRPLIGLKVELQERDLPSLEEQAPLVVGETETTSFGYFIRYDTEQFAEDEAQPQAPDLQVRLPGVTQDGTSEGEPYTSVIHYNAPHVLIVDLELSAPQAQQARREQPSEYALHCQRTAEAACDVAPRAWTKADTAFLNGETDIPIDQLRYLRLDARWSAQYGVQGGVFYGLFRKGLPTVLPRLLAKSPERWHSAIVAAIEEIIVPASLRDGLDGVIDRLEDLADEVAVIAGEGEGGMPEVATLAATVLSDDQRRAFARALRRGELGDDLWSELAASSRFGAEAVAHARFALSAEPMVRGHLPMLRALDQHRQRMGWTELVDLARMTRDDWQRVAADGEAGELAAVAAHNVEVAFPTMTVARRFENDGDAARADVARFLIDNPDFDVLRSHADTVLRNGAVLGNVVQPDQLAPRLKAVSRAARLVADTDLAKLPPGGLAGGIQTLLDNGFDSARSVYRAGRPRFLETMTAILGAVPAEAVFNAAIGRLDFAEMANNHLRDYVRDPVRAIPSLPVDDPPEDWRFLFEGPSGCECEHCRSVLSPAAYLADLLKSLEDSPHDERSPYEVVTDVERRPDIPRLKLSCANANTPLPYIDLVNEILADAVAGEPVQPRNTSGDAGERRAMPEPLRPGADTAVSTAAYPWTLPFEAGHQEAMTWAEHLGLDLEELRRTVSPDAADLSRLYFGIGPELWRLLERPEISTGRSDVWPGRIDALRRVPAFLSATGLSHAELVVLTRSWVSTGGAGGLSIDTGGIPCDLSAHRLVGLEPAVFDRLQRHVRLCRHLGWAIDEDSELDAALEALRVRRFSPEALDDLAALHRAAASLRRPIRELAAAGDDGFAEMLRLGEVEMALLRRLLGVSSTAAIRDRIRVVDGYRLIRATGFAIRELANLLLGWDQSPAAFFPSAADSRAFLLRLHREHEAEVAARMAALESDAEAAAALAAAAVAAADVDGFLRRWFGEQLIVDRLSDRLEVEAEVVDRLIRASSGPAILSATDPSRPAVADFTAVATVAAGDDPDLREPALFEAASSTLARLARAARLVSRLDLSRTDLDAVAGFGAASGFLVLDLGPALDPDPAAPARLTGFFTLHRAVELSRSLPGKTNVFSLLAAAADGFAGADLADPESFAGLEEATGWPRADIAGALDGLGLATPGALGRAGTYERVGAVLHLARRFDVEPPVVVAWGGPGSPAALASSLRGAAERRTNEDRAAWLGILTPISDRLREARRDALLACLLAKRDFDSAAEVYARYLIDPEMSACQLTSRIKQANASVQLFIQRLLMGLETEVVLNSDAREHWQHWQWMKNYRVWEANRKVFLFPENWILSELRDDKSSFFQALENELLQNDVTTESAEAAYFGYVDKLDAVSRLDVRALYFERDDGRSAEGMRGGVGPGTLHLFGRTRSSPHIYHYRWRDRSLTWSPWERIDLPIEGDHLVPFAQDGRLVLVWVSFREDRDGDHERWTPEISWSERQNSSWTPTQTTDVPPGWLWDRETPPSERFFRLEESDGGLYIETYNSTSPDDQGNSAAHTFEGIRKRIPYFERCDRRIIFAQRDYSLSGTAYLPPWSLSEGGQAVELEERESGEDALQVLGPSDPEDPEGPVSSSLLDRTPGEFRVTPSHQQTHFVRGAHFTVEIARRVYLATPRLRFGSLPHYTFEHLYHPYLCEIGQALYEGGPDQLLAPPWTEPGHSLDRQLLSEIPRGELFPTFEPTGLVLKPYPYEQVEFTAEGAFSGYNWELFFHIPLLVAERLTQNQRFEEARRWFHFIFDPTDVSRHRGVEKFWRTRPFYERAKEPPATIEKVLEGLAAGELGAEDQIEAWKGDPFNPHLLARHRTLAYMRTVVMKYLDNLIAWGDDLFARDTLESLNEATQLYVLAAEILGDAPETIEAPERAAKSYEELGELDAFANALEDALPVEAGRSGSTGTVPHRALYFCVPSNDKLAAYRATIADRLRKIRTCLDVEGRLRQLPLFEPPIDPGLLVRARAAGLDLRDVLALSDDVGLPHYRYALLLAKAVEVCGDVRALGNALASALERKDGEELARLRSRHEVTLLSRVSDVKRQQVEEAGEALEALRASKRSSELRRAKLEAWAEEYRNPAEQAQLAHLHDAHGFEVTSQGFQVAASIAHLLPDIKAGVDAGTTWGGSHLGNAARAASSAAGIISGQYTFEASMCSIEGAHQRRRAEWLHQAELAGIELKQLDRQILAAEIRLAVARSDQRNHRAQLRQAREVEDFLSRKFSNQELYGWMVGQLSKLYRDSYRMARELAVRAERAARHELGLEAGELRSIGFDHWDSLRRGLLAGDKLHHDLRRLDTAYHERNRRRLEITKHISLAQLNPEQLVALRETGKCSFKVPELLFDIEFPGHYRRRIKSVSVTVPAVTGPTTNVGAVLTLKRSWIRQRPDTAAGYARDPTGDSRFIDAPVAQSSIATSSAQRDSGVFELNFHDQRYLPFEGAGAESEWTLELPAAIRTFDYDTISDVILHLSYTAWDDAPADFRTAVEDHVENNLDSWLSAVGGSGEGMVRVVSLRREMSAQLHQLLHPPAGASIHRAALSLEPKHLPHFLRRYLEPKPRQPALEVVAAQVVVKLRGDVGDSEIEFGPSASPEPSSLVTTAAWGGLPHASFPPAGGYRETFTQEWIVRFDPGRLSSDLTEELDGFRRLRPESVEDVYIAFSLGFVRAPRSRHA